MEPPEDEERQVVTLEAYDKGRVRLPWAAAKRFVPRRGVRVRLHAVPRDGALAVQCAILLGARASLC